ncbi:MAG: hypothetical protein WCA89_02220 [Terracidiphilus sp.]|jgi:hypothetical protein
MLAVVLFGCRKEQRYPGFTLVGVDGNLSYFVDASTIRRATGAKQFSFVQLIENPTGEYDVGEAMVDCDSLVTIAGEAGHYDRQQHFISNTSQHTQSIASIANFVCPQRKNSPFPTGPSNSEEAIPTVQNLAANQQAQGSNPSANRSEAPQEPTPVPVVNSKPSAYQKAVTQEPKPLPVENPNPLAQPPSIAEIGQQAIALWNQKRYSDAIPLFNQACSDGKTNSCYYLGLMYDFGQGVSQDSSRAAVFYSESCKAGNGVACFHLGMLRQYQPGSAVCKSPALALGASKGCDSGNAMSCTILGYSNIYGCGIAMDTEKGRQLLSKGCSMGYKRACDGIK